MTDFASVIFGGISIVLVWSIVRPIKKIGILNSRKKTGFALIAVLFLNGIIIESTTSRSQKGNKKIDEVKKDCNGVFYDDLVAPEFNQVLYVLPNKSSKKLINETATSVMGHLEYHQIDRTETVRRLCVLSEWSKIKMEYPSHLRDVTGWVPNKSLREIKRDGKGVRIYTEQDISWDNDTKKYKKQIVGAINRIHRENAQCKYLNTGLIMQIPKTPKNKPLFFVICGDSNDSLFSISFSPDDYLKKKSFAAINSISKEAATDRCEQVAKLSAIYPSTVDFSRILSLSFNTFPTGRARIDTTFTAKNAFNVSSDYNISCLFEGDELIEKNIYEKR